MDKVRSAAFTSLLVLVASLAAAQPSVRLSVEPSLEAFAVPAAERETRSAIAGLVSAEYAFGQERGRVFYSLDMGRFGTEGDWTYRQHEAGLVYRVGGERGRLFLSGSGGWRDNGSAWDAADYRWARAGANLELRPRGGFTLRLGYRLDGRTFPRLEALDQTEHDGFASLLLNSPSRTTLIGEIHVGRKSYAGAAGVELDPALSSDWTPGSRRGRAMGPGVRGGAASVVPAAPAPDDRAGQVTWLVRAAQSLAERTGGSLQYLRRRTSGRVPPLLVATPALLYDDGVYDDPFASDRSEWRAGIKHAFAGGARFEAYAAFERKVYDAIPPLDLSGVPLGAGVLRVDRLWRAAARASAPILPARTGPIEVTAGLAYTFARHRSNDAFYSYTVHAAGLELSLGY